MAIKVPNGSERTGTPRNIFPAGDFLFEVQSVDVKESFDEQEGFKKGTNLNIRLSVEDVMQDKNERLIGATFFHNVFLMDEEHPKFDEPLKNDISNPPRTVGDLGYDQLADIAIAAGLEMDEEFDEQELVGARVWGRVRVYKDKNTGEDQNDVRKWSPVKE